MLLLFREAINGTLPQSIVQTHIGHVIPPTCGQSFIAIPVFEFIIATLQGITFYLAHFGLDHSLGFGIVSFTGDGLQVIVATQRFELWMQPCRTARATQYRCFQVTQDHSASGKAVVYKSQIVPLKGSGDAKTAYVVHYDWPEFSRQFASLASEIESNGEFDVSVLPAIGALQFVPRDAESKYLFGVEREVVVELLEEGFNHVQVIESGSRPATTEDAIAATLMGSVTLTLGLFWIRFRRRNKARRNAQRKDLTTALENAAWLGASEGVQRALVSDADGS